MFLNTFRTRSHIHPSKGEHLSNLTLVTILMCPISLFLGPLHGLEFHWIRENIWRLRVLSVTSLGMLNNKKYIIYIIIERIFRFKEPLQDLKLVEEETAKPLPLSDEDSGDENESLCYDISDDMYDINEHE